MNIMEQKIQEQIEDSYYEDELRENSPHEYCPKCGIFFDDADFDFQICHKCKWDAENEKYIK